MHLITLHRFRITRVSECADARDQREPRIAAWPGVSFSALRVVPLTLAFGLIVGCGGGDRPSIGFVAGVITIDGMPAPNLAVSFSQRGFRVSTGRTNDQGEYELRYVRDVRGAVIGEHKVKIERVASNEDSIRASLPDRYNSRTELTAVVDRGSNQIDFDLLSK